LSWPGGLEGGRSAGLPGGWCGLAAGSCSFETDLARNSSTGESRCDAGSVRWALGVSARTGSFVCEVAAWARTGSPVARTRQATARAALLRLECVMAEKYGAFG